MWPDGELQRPELTQDDHLERAPITEAPVQRSSSRARSASGGRAMPASHSRPTRIGAPTPYEMRPTERNERFALLMSKRSRSPELRRTAYISPMLPLQSVPLAAEMLEYEQRLQNMSRAKGASRSGQVPYSASVYHPLQEANMYSTLARNYHAQGLSAYSGRSLYGDRTANSLSRSYASSGGSYLGNPFDVSIGSSGMSRANATGRSLESSVYRNAVHGDRPSIGVPLWAQHKFV